MRVVVIGAGVIGLSCAVRLAEAGHDVGVFARDLPPETTSSVAAAMWYPYLASPQGRVAEWAAVTYRELARLAEAESSIRLRSGMECLVKPQPDPWWADTLPDFHRVTPPDGFAEAWAFTSPVVEMGRYLPYLVSRLEAAGGSVTRATMAELPTNADVVVNCSGLGARLLAGDRTVTPVRGQVVYLVRPPEVTEWLVADAGDQGLTYVVPREDDVVVGGTNEPDRWDREPQEETGAAMLERATALVPALRGATVLGHRVGLRPTRPEIRCEAVQAGRRLVVHCYGHGGAGVTLSWGCADEVLRYVLDAAS